MRDPIEIKIEEIETTMSPDRKAVLQLTLDGGKWAVGVADVGQGDGIPCSIHYGVVRVYDLASAPGPVCYDAEAVKAFIDENRLLLAEIAAGHDAEHDDQVNLVGTLTPEAAAAESALIDRIEGRGVSADKFNGSFFRDDLTAWTADDWLAESDLQDLESETPEALEEAARSDGVAIEGGADAIRDHIESLRKDREDA